MTHLALQVVLAVFAVGAILFAWFESRRDGTRIPLSRGMTLGIILVGLVPIAASVPLLYWVFSSELIPKDSPVAFGAFMVSYAVGTVALTIAAIVRHGRRHAAGWLTVLEDGALHVVTDGLDEKIVLAPGDVRAFYVNGKPQFLQFQIPCSRGALLLLGMVPVRDLSMAEEGRVVEPQGLVLGSTRAFLNAVRAYVVS